MQLNRVAYQIFTHLRLNFKTHAGNTYPYHEPQHFLERLRVLYGKLFPWEYLGFVRFPPLFWVKKSLDAMTQPFKSYQFWLLQLIGFSLSFTRNLATTETGFFAG